MATTKAFEAAKTVNQTDADTLVQQFAQISKSHPEFAAAFRVISLTICAEALGSGRHGRGNILTDLGTRISHLVVKTALEISPSRSLAAGLVEQLNASLAIQALKNSLHGVDVDEPAQIDVAQFRS